MPQNVKHLMKVHFVLSKLLSTLDFKVSEFVNKTLSRHISVIRDTFCQELTRAHLFWLFFAKFVLNLFKTLYRRIQELKTSYA